jgi:undecaprenyl-diphosphatase
MPLYQIVLLAVVQGITEFLPISSSAHLYLTSWLLGWQAEDLNFDIALHVGTLAAVLFYFFRTWLEVAARGFGLDYGSDAELRKRPMLLWYLALGSLPIGALGFAFKDQAETAWRNPFVMGGMLVGVGILMWAAERAGRRERGMGDISWTDSAAIGAAQALAIVPGTSRSGITIVAGLFRGLDRDTAARFSFLLSTPAIAGAAAKAFYDLMKQGHVEWGPFLAGAGVSAVTGFVVIGWFLRYLRQGALNIFIYYRVIFGIIVLALAFSRGSTG